MLRSVLIKLTVQIDGANFLNSRANEKVPSAFLQIKSSRSKINIFADDKLPLRYIRSICDIFVG